MELQMARKLMMDLEKRIQQLLDDSQHHDEEVKSLVMRIKLRDDENKKDKDTINYLLDEVDNLKLQIKVLERDQGIIRTGLIKANETINGLLS